MELSVKIERWPLANPFTISRGSKTEAVVVTVELGDGAHRGRGECVPYARYHETPEGVVAAIEAMSPALEGGLDRAVLQEAMPAGAARNALDCAFWDIHAKQSGRRVYELAGFRVPKPLVTAYTISLAAASAMAEAAERASTRPLLKVKLGGADGDDGLRIAAVRRTAPKAELIVDANEGWTEDNLARNLAACADAGVTLVEQPLPEGNDGALARIKRPIPVCAERARFVDLDGPLLLAGDRPDGLRYVGSLAYPPEPALWG
jgi:L-Ala-D/L-Glu epimerase